ncbi:efflux RND transporter periplasmic adaptor subunit [Priestia megaterium]|uniref:efflux RND transporter periplasmic adaptor subunit n=1 Tax=Priestia megaterium TaxID=1404 RepID=UPI002452BF66|nr:efflux RND transporter periplasmic adaptor subunit [Priestia megaterium]MDH3161183.1 efflux RND transporter periplasmic adaptor subunit [Priestia megaterium]MED4117218.1 efflux RND transporter periplasmic adaptor subunit [Priestia megaterium]
MRKKLIISIISSFVLIVLGINVYLSKGSASNKEIDVNVTQLKERTLKRTVIIPGTLSLANEQYIYYNAEKGDLDKIHVTEGSIVQVGTPIVTYENDEIELEKEQHELGGKSSQLQINSLNKQIANLNLKQKNLETELGKEEAKNQIDIERTQLKLDLETAKLDLEKNNLESKSTLKREQDLEVKSDIKGTVLEVNKEAINNTSEVQNPVIHIGSTDEYIARGVLSEYDALNIQPGQSVVITSDVLPNKKWEGSVKQIDYLPQKQTASDSTSDTANQYPVEIKVDDEDISSIKPGFKLLLEIETTSKKARSLPIKSIVNEGKHKYVYVVENGLVSRKKVKVGETTSKFIEITSGVSEKEKVVSNPSAKLSDGLEVSIK